MPGKTHLPRGRKDPNVGLAIHQGCGKYKRGLRKVELACDPLHRLITEANGVWKDRQLIPLQRHLRKHVDQAVSVVGHVSCVRRAALRAMRRAGYRLHSDETRSE